MSAPLLDLAILTELERRLGRDRIAKVIEIQISNGRELSQRLTVLENSLDRSQIKALAHQIAGSSGSIGLIQLSEQAVTVELVAPNAGEAELKRQLGDLKACLETSRQQLLAQYPEIDGN